MRDAKLFYLLFFSSLACLVPYLNLFFRRVCGLTEAQIGLIACLRPWVGVAAGVAWAGLADATRAHRTVLLATLVGATAARLSIGLTRAFPAALAAALLTEGLAAPVTIVADAAVSAACEPGEYGHQRLWGAVGWGSMALAAGAAIGRLGLGAAFALHGGLALLVLAPAARLPLGPLHARLAGGAEGAEAGAAGASTPQKEVEAAAFCARAARLAADPEVAVFLAMAGALGFGVGHIDNYLFLLLDELGAPEGLMGLSLAVTCAAETAVFLRSGALIRRLGTRGCFHLVFAAFIVRLGGYAALPSAPTPWLVLPLELLHGLTFALTWAAGTEYILSAAPPGLESTAQGAFQGVLFGAGHGAGGLVGGRLYAAAGARAMFAAAAVALGAAWAATTAAWAAVDARAARPRYAPVGVQLAGRDEGASSP